MRDLGQATIFGVGVARAGLCLRLDFGQVVALVRVRDRTPGRVADPDHVGPAVLELQKGLVGSVDSGKAPTRAVRQRKRDSANLPLDESAAVVEALYDAIRANSACVIPLD